MKSHITEEQLIQWLFDLADPDEAKIVAAHVGQCDACATLKTQIERKFAVQLLPLQAALPIRLADK